VKGQVGLVDIDSHNFPNLVLMKLSAWHKSQGDSVELLKPNDLLKGANLFGGYDYLYGACVFNWNRQIADKLSEIGVQVGGTGSGNDKTLPHEIEHIMPDYSLYGITDTAYGFLTRGCPRRCPFCIVGNKEGLVSRKVADLSEFWNGQKNIVLCDPNILASHDHMELLYQLADSKAVVDFNQGLDARLLTKENITVLKQIKIKRIHFAWDNPKDSTVPKALEMFAEEWGIKPKHHAVVVYVLTNYWSDIDEDLKRIYWLREHGYSPYIMVYDKEHAPKTIKKLQRWVNNRFVFYSTNTFDEYVKKGVVSVE